VQISRKGNRRTFEFFGPKEKEGPEESGRAPRSAVRSGIKWYQSGINSLFSVAEREKIHHAAQKRKTVT
jgi:hypothetical protein